VNRQPVARQLLAASTAEPVPKRAQDVPSRPEIEQAIPGTPARNLTDADVDAIATRIARKLAAPGERWLTTDQVAGLLGVSVDFVYEHQRDFGVRRLGDGKRAPLRFRHDLVMEGIDRLSGDVVPPPAPRRRGRPRTSDRRPEILGGLKARPV
jgi:hypothetical protein